MEKYSRFRVMYKENLTQYERAAYVIHGMDPGTIAIVDASFETETPGVYACGDAVRGADLVVTAIADGRKCAAAVHAAVSA